ncbi:hypothetical protein F4821DRAFT_209459 [Hypoxylon rubiginosum]|uniref:Uncharacterized protein n=1 Tax=Hypoxylon rubiginosum TaxID=110542 RepID=A0ACC0DDY2_9PEZI|nr:hypothetical protein F4821DRAFT_209459 [Hypoxylon rubiginosum]
MTNTRYVSQLQDQVSILRQRLSRLESQSSGDFGSLPDATTVDIGDVALIDPPMLTASPTSPFSIETNAFNTTANAPSRPYRTSNVSITSVASATAHRWCALTGRTLELHLPSVVDDLSVGLEAVIHRSHIEHTIVRDLISIHYIPVIHVQCPIVTADQLLLDVHLKHLLPQRQLIVGLAAAVAAAHRARRRPELYSVACSLRGWAEELCQPVLSRKDWAALQSLMLLILYEMVEPSRGLLPSLLSTACRLGISLAQQDATSAPRDMNQNVTRGDSNCLDHPSSFRRQLLTRLLVWERIVSTTSDRPTLLPENAIPQVLLKHFSLPGWGTSQTICQLPRLDFYVSKLANGNCPLSDDCVNLVTADMNEGDLFNLRMYPLICHECVRCQSNRHAAVRSLMPKIRQSAINMISTIDSAQRNGDIICVWLVAQSSFFAGLVLIDQVLKENITLYEQCSSRNDTWDRAKTFLMVCARVLAVCAELWRPGKNLRDVFDSFLKTIISS